MPIATTGVAITGLGGPMGYGELEVPRGDDSALRLDVSSVFADGFTYFGRQYGPTDLFVNTNGTVSFGADRLEYPTLTNSGFSRDFLAPFWADVDTRLDGEGAESGSIWVDIDAASDVVTITWDDVGLYRRDASLANTFQVQLADRGGGDFDITFRYETIEWTQGSSDVDAGARVGIVSSNAAQTQWFIPLAAATSLTTLPTLIGNTGFAGYWTLSMQSGQLRQPLSEVGQPPTGTALNDRLTGTSGADRLIGLA